jgi:hypothetical protein
MLMSGTSSFVSGMSVVNCPSLVFLGALCVLRASALGVALACLEN